MSDFEIPNKPSAKLDASKLDPYKPDTAAAEAQKPDAPKNNSTYTPEDLAQVFDEVIFSGEYRETFKIKHVDVTFRTRTAEELEQVQLALDASKLTLMSTIEQKRSLMLLERALVAYAGKDLSLMKSVDKEAFVKRLPGPVVGALLDLLNRFDDKVFQACREGEANF